MTLPFKEEDMTMKEQLAKWMPVIALVFFCCSCVYDCWRTLLERYCVYRCRNESSFLRSNLQEEKRCPWQGSGNEIRVFDRPWNRECAFPNGNYQRSHRIRPCLRAWLWKMHLSESFILQGYWPRAMRMQQTKYFVYSQLSGTEQQIRGGDFGNYIAWSGALSVSDQKGLKEINSSLQ